MSVLLRAAQLSDDRPLADIDFSCWSEATDPGPHWERDRAFFGPPNATAVADVLVAVDADKPDTLLGYIKISPTPSRYGDWYIGGLGVAPAARRRGVAHTLVQAALCTAASLGGNRVWLKVLSTNEPATRLYRSLGFAEVEHIRSPFPSRPGADDLRLARSASAD